MYVNILSTWIWAYVCLWGTVESITYTRVVLLSLSMLKRVKGGDASQGCKVCYCSNGPWAYRPESGGENPVVSKKLRVYPAIKSPPKNMKKKLWYVICIYIYTYYAHVLLIYCIGFMDFLRLQWQHLIPKPCMSRTTPMRTNIKSPHTTEWWLGPIHHPGSRIETRTQETLKSSSTTYSAFFQRKALYVDILCTTDECTSNE